MKREPLHTLANILWVVVLITLVAFASGSWLTGSASAKELSAPHLTDHAGTISTTETWYAAGNPHIITGNLTISATTGKVLLEPGVEIQIFSGGKLTVQGVLTTTVSAPALPITISKIIGSSNFGQIEFTATSSGYLSNCDISQGGTGYPEVILINSTSAQGVTLDNCTIHDNTAGSQVINLNGVSVKAKLSNLTIQNNPGMMAIAQSHLRATPVYKNITLSNNTAGNFLEVGRLEATVLNGNKITLTGNEFLPDGVIALTQGATISAGGALTATVGTNLQISPGKNILVQGSNLSPFAGRFYADGVDFVNRPSQSAFGVINFNSYSAGRVSNCDISGGGSGTGITEVVRISSSDVTLEDCHFHDNIVSGRVVYLGGGSTDPGLHPTLRNLEFNLNTAPYLVEQSTVDMAVTYDNLNMHDNGGAREGVYLGSGTLNRINVLDQVELNGDPYYVGSASVGLTIAASGGVTLTAGTELRILPGRPITVQGKLIGKGTVLQPVYFRSVADAPLAGEQWGYIDIKSGATVDLNYCDISHAAGGVIPAPVSLPAVLSIASSNSSVNNCTVHNNVGTADTFAVLLAEPAAGAGNSAHIANTTITNNSGWALGQNSLNMTPTYQNPTLSGNNGGVGDLLLITGPNMTTAPVLGNNKIYLDSPAINGRPIYLLNGATIAASGVITVTPSTTLYVGGTGTPGKKIDVSGRFIAAGGSGAGQRIKIQNRGTSAGDNFGQIDFKIGSTGRLAYTDVSNGGKGFTEMVRIDSTNVALEDSTFSGSIGTAQVVSIVSQNLKPTLRNLVIQNGLGYAVAQASANMAPVYDNLMLQGNVINGVYLNTGTVNYDLTLNIDELNGAPYYAGSMTFPTGKAITLTQGTELRLLSAAVLTINTGARLEMEGTPQRWVTVRSDKESPTVTDYWNTIDIKNGATARFQYCDVSGGGRGGVNVLATATSSATPTTFAFDYCNIHNNGTGGGVQNTIALIGSTATVTYTMQNVAVHDNNAGGIYAASFVNLDLKHVSLLKNTRHGVQTGAGGAIKLYNSIIAWNGTGFISGGTANTSEVNAVLWYGNTPKFTGNPFIFQDNWDAYELPMAWDGYHLSRYATEALNYTRAAPTGVVDDIDSEALPTACGHCSGPGGRRICLQSRPGLCGRKGPLQHQVGLCEFREPPAARIPGESVPGASRPEFDGLGAGCFPVRVGLYSRRASGLDGFLQPGECIELAGEPGPGHRRSNHVVDGRHGYLGEWDHDRKHWGSDFGDARIQAGCDHDSAGLQASDRLAFERLGVQHRNPDHHRCGTARRINPDLCKRDPDQHGDRQLGGFLQRSVQLLWRDGGADRRRLLWRCVQRARNGGQLEPVQRPADCGDVGWHGIRPEPGHGTPCIRSDGHADDLPAGMGRVGTLAGELVRREQSKGNRSPRDLPFHQRSTGDLSCPSSRLASLPALPQYLCDDLERRYWHCKSALCCPSEQRGAEDRAG